MNFIKMHGLGNDFVVIQEVAWEAANPYQAHAALICDRHWGIGADGLVVMGKDAEYDIFMRIFNPDGSEAEMCGNAIRCVARHAYEQGLVSQTGMAIRTLAGIRYPEVILTQGQFAAVRVDMGEPILERAKIPMSGPGSNVDHIDIVEMTLPITAVSMGNPHTIIFVDRLDDIPVEQWGPLVEHYPLFPARTNVEFVQVLGEEEIIMRVWERGAGVTMACGTGACATLVASSMTGRTSRRATVHLLGGDLSIEWDEGTNHVYMTGGADKVFEGFMQID